jgi:hypothetical protein
LKLIKRLRQKGPADRDRDRDELDLDWALQQYVDQEGACFYTGVTLTLSGPIYTTPFVLSFAWLHCRLRPHKTCLRRGQLPIPPRRVGQQHVQVRDKSLIKCQRSTEHWNPERDPPRCPTQT